MNLFLRAQYVWGPGDNGVDELLCQIEPYSQAENHTGSGGPQGKPWFILTDAQGDVVSIASVGMGLGGGNPVASVAGQWTYSPYGEVLTYDQIAAHPELVFGHKTLAIDRLDAPALTWENESAPGAADGALFETRRLEPGARLLAYARNRTLDIQRGRWLQTDPNASGLALLDDLGFQGARAGFANVFCDLSFRTNDTMSLWETYSASPITESDPAGLFLSLPGLLVTGLDALDNATSALEGAADNLRMMLSTFSMLSQYASDQMSDAEWALDWSLPDTAYSRNTQDFGIGEVGPADAQGNDFIACGIRTGKLSLPKGFHSGAKNTIVYVGKRKGKTVYVGITTNRAARQASHKSDGRAFTLHPLKGKFNNLEARSIETNIIRKHPEFENTILSISPQNEWFGAAMQWASKNTPRLP